VGTFVGRFLYYCARTACGPKTSPADALKPYWELSFHSWNPSTNSSWNVWTTHKPIPRFKCSIWSQNAAETASLMINVWTLWVSYVCVPLSIFVWMYVYVYVYWKFSSHAALSIAPSVIKVDLSAAGSWKSSSTLTN